MIFFLQSVRQVKQTISIFVLRRSQNVLHYVLNILFFIVLISSFSLSRLSLPLSWYVLFKLFIHPTKFSPFYPIFSKLSLSFLPEALPHFLSFLPKFLFLSWRHLHSSAFGYITGVLLLLLLLLLFFFCYTSYCRTESKNASFSLLLSADLLTNFRGETTDRYSGFSFTILFVVTPFQL